MISYSLYSAAILHILYISSTCRKGTAILYLLRALSADVYCQSPPMRYIITFLANPMM